MPVHHRVEHVRRRPAVLAAQTGGSVDVGFMAETPLVFAQAAGNPVKVVAASQVVDPKTSSFAIVVPPDSDIKKCRGLKGKKIGYSSGTITQYFLLNALKKAGLEFTDVRRSTSPVSAARPRSRTATSTPPSPRSRSSPGSSPTGRRASSSPAPGSLPGSRTSWPATTRCKDKKTSAALSDFVARVARAQKWWGEHPAEVAKANEETFKLSPEAALAAAKRRPRRQYVPIDDTVVAAQQKESDAFLELGVIPKKLVAKDLFDTRYNKVVAAVAAESS